MCLCQRKWALALGVTGYQPAKESTDLPSVSKDHRFFARECHVERGARRLARHVRERLVSLKVAISDSILTFYLMVLVHPARAALRRGGATEKGRTLRCVGPRYMQRVRSGARDFLRTRDLFPPVGFVTSQEVRSTRETPGAWRWRHRPTGHINGARRSPQIGDGEKLNGERGECQAHEALVLKV